MCGDQQVSRTQLDKTLDHPVSEKNKDRSSLAEAARIATRTVGDDDSEYVKAVVDQEDIEK